MVVVLLVMLEELRLAGAAMLSPLRMLVMQR